MEFASCEFPFCAFWDFMASFLITGGAGVVGARLSSLFLEMGHSVRVLTLPGQGESKRLPKDVEIFYGDVRKPESLLAPFQDVDTVCHLAAVILAGKREAFEKVNLEGTRNVLLAAKSAGVKRFLFVSSISVTYPDLTDYGKSKLRAESLVQDMGIPFTIVRPTLVVERTGGAEYMLFMRYLKKAPLVFLPGKGRCLKRPVRTEDLVRGIALAATSPAAVGKTYALAGSKVMSLLDMAKISMERAGIHKKIYGLPLWICHFLALLKQILIPGSVSARQALAGFRENAAPEISDAEKDLGYRPGSPF